MLLHGNDDKIRSIQLCTVGTKGEMKYIVSRELTGVKNGIIRPVFLKGCIRRLLYKFGIIQVLSLNLHEMIQYHRT
jgi:hypothetical protein